MRNGFWMTHVFFESDGYHYAFLQSMNVDSGKHIGMEYDIHLFTNISLQAESSRLIELIRIFGRRVSGKVVCRYQ